MPLDDSIGMLVLRGILGVLRFLGEILLEYVLAWIGKGAVYVVTFGRVNLEIEDASECTLAALLGLLACFAMVGAAYFFGPAVKALF